MVGGGVGDGLGLSSVGGFSVCCGRLLDLGDGSGEWARVRVGVGRDVGWWVTRTWEVVGMGVGVSLGDTVVSSGPAVDSVAGSVMLGRAVGSSVGRESCCPAGAHFPGVEHAASGLEPTEDDTIQPPATASTTIAARARMSRLFLLPFSSSRSFSSVQPKLR